MTEKDWTIFLPNPDRPLTDDQRAAAIADVLKVGNPSPTFCNMLAEMIRPNGRNVVPYRLKLCRKNQGRPKGYNVPIGREMVRFVDDEKLTVDEAVFRVQQAFGKKGNSKRTCEAARQAELEFRACVKALDERRRR